MKILATVDVGPSRVTQSWELEKGHIIVRRLTSEVIAIPLDESRIHLLKDIDELFDQLEKAPQQKEYLEAVFDALDRVYLGNVSLSDAVLLKIES